MNDLNNAASLDIRNLAFGQMLPKETLKCNKNILLFENFLTLVMTLEIET